MAGFWGMWGWAYNDMERIYYDETDLFGGLEAGEVRTNNSVTATGQALRLVVCEDCSHQYGYLVRRFAKVYAMRSGSYGGQALDDAGKIAKKTVKMKLKIAIDMVPCPECGCVQKPMFPLARKRHLRGLMHIGIFLFVVAVLVCLTGSVIYFQSKPAGPVSGMYLIFAGALGGLGLFGLVLIVSRFVLAHAFDPNTLDVTERIRYGKRRALKPHKLEQARKTFGKKGMIYHCEDD